MMTGNGGMWFGGGYMWLLWIVVPIVVIWAIKSLSGSSGTNDASSNSQNNTIESPLDILKKRFANGDIDKAEYNERLDELNKK